MTNIMLKKISENHNLVKFCNKILSYNSIFLDEYTRNMFLVSLISADSLIDEQSCDETIDVANFILNHIDCLIDGRYEQDKRDITLPLRGSSNQRIIYLNI